MKKQTFIKAIIKAILGVSCLLLCAGTGFAAQQRSGSPEVNRARIASWYKDTVFVGDSVMQGFRSYAAQHDDIWLGSLNFLSSGNFSVYNAMHSGVQPMYMGQKVTVWDGVKKIGANRVFIELGLNDFNIASLEVNAEAYEDFVKKILEVNPGTDINIISMTYTYPGYSSGSLNNANIRRYNSLLQAMAARNGWGFVDLANPLSDGDGNLSPVYCSDFYIHQNDAAYEVWTDVLLLYAAERLGINRSSVLVSDPGWTETDKGRIYLKADGSRLSGGWHWIDDDHDGTAECYFFYDDDTLAYNTRTPDNFRVNAKGQWEIEGKVRTENIALY